METSPVGVAVFDAWTAEPGTLNRGVSSRCWWKRTGGASGPRARGPGLGARFAFTLPASEEAVTNPPRANGPTREAASVLVVDDNPETLRHVRDALTEAGYVALATGEPTGTNCCASSR